MQVRCWLVFLPIITQFMLSVHTNTFDLCFACIPNSMCLNDTVHVCHLSRLYTCSTQVVSWCEPLSVYHNHITMKPSEPGDLFKQLR